MAAGRQLCLVCFVLAGLALCWQLGLCPPIFGPAAPAAPATGPSTGPSRGPSPGPSPAASGVPSPADPRPTRVPGMPPPPLTMGAPASCFTSTSAPASATGPFFGGGGEIPRTFPTISPLPGAQAFLSSPFPGLTASGRRPSPVPVSSAAARAPWKASGMGLIRVGDQYVVTVLREWMRQHYQAREHFREMQREYMNKVYRYQGGCPEVMTPDSGPLPNYPHLWSSLHATVTYVGAPLWMPGKCTGKTPIVVGARKRDTHA